MICGYVLRTRAADGVEVPECEIFDDAEGEPADPHHLLRRDRVHDFLAGGRVVAAAACLPGIGGVFQVAVRGRLYLPVREAN
jgi:hypothetical protein